MNGALQYLACDTTQKLAEFPRIGAILRHAYAGLRTGTWICYTPNIRGFVVLLARVEARIEAIEIAAHHSLFAVLTFSGYVDRSSLRSIVGARICQHAANERGKKRHCRQSFHIAHTQKWRMSEPCVSAPLAKNGNYTFI